MNIMKKIILFQGDSITDCARNRENDMFLGVGYARMVEAQLGLECPNKYTFLNRGINGNRIVDVYARIKSDIINLKPDYLSILIGVNDVWHELGNKNGVAAEKFEKIYEMMLEEIKEAVPNVKIMIMLPYVVEGPATCNNEENPERFDYFKCEVAKRADAARRVAEKFNLPYIDLQTAFDKASQKAESTYWAYDGVHPTAMGHELIKREWLKGFEKIK